MLHRFANASRCAGTAAKPKPYETCSLFDFAVGHQVTVIVNFTALQLTGAIAATKVEHATLFHPGIHALLQVAVLRCSFGMRF